VRYVFSPTLQLTFPFSPVNNLFFEANTDSRFRWLVTEMNRAVATGTAPAPDSHGGGFRHSLLQFRNYRAEPGPIQLQLKVAAGKEDLALPREGQSAGALAGGPRSRGETSWGVPATFFSTILHAAQRRTQTLSESLARSTRESGRPGGGRVREAEKILVLLRPDFERGGKAARAESSSPASLKTMETVNALTLRRSFFTRLTLHARSAGTAASPGYSFAAPSITFAAPRPADQGRRNAGFVPPLALSYARREPPQSQAVVNALRDLRSPQSEARPQAAPQLPSIEQLTSQVSRQLERELRIEKERRGL
jgi:hypothetical protein